MKLSQQIFCNSNEKPLLGNFEVSIDPGSIDLEVSGTWQYGNGTVVQWSHFCWRSLGRAVVHSDRNKSLPAAILRRPQNCQPN